MSGSAPTDFNPGADPNNFEFRVLSNAEIQTFVHACGSEVNVNMSQMKARMEHEEHLNRQQINYMHQEFQAQNLRIVNFCRNEYEQVKEEAHKHQQYWISEVGEHQQMLADVQANLFRECGISQMGLTHSGLQLSQEAARFSQEC